MLFSFWLFAVCSWLFADQRASLSDTYALIVAGLGGEKQYEQRFRTQATALAQAAEKLSGDASKVVTLSAEKADRETVRRELRALAGKAKRDDQLIVVLLGHGTYDGEEYRFNVPGPDLTGTELAALFDQIPARDQLIVNATSASGAAIDRWKRDNRVVITSTKSGGERTATRFAQYWLEAVSTNTADTNRDDVVTAAEAYDFASCRVADSFKADVSLNPDAGMMGIDQPTITYGLRGLAYFEINVWGPKADLHSGLYGGAVHNPAQVLAELIAKMHDKKGRITLPGFYDSVRKLSKQERADFARLPNDDAHYLEETGVPALWGEDGYTSAERTGARPTLEVNGLLSGWTGQGSKTVLPAKAMAKISCRLVADQHPDEVEEQMIRFMEENAPKTVKWEVKDLTHSPFAIADLNNPGVKAMHKAMESVWGIRPFYRREGGSIGAVAMLQQICGVESVLVGMGLPSDNVHSPNEHMHLPTWYKGIDAFIHFLHNLG